jgi:hypothetical protein
MARSNQRGRKNNNPEGRNQYSNGWMDTAKERPMATAAAAAAAVGAGVFLWSRRNQISDQLSNLSDQITDWASDMRTGSADGSGREMEMAEGSDLTSTSTGSSSSSGRRSSTGTRSGAGSRSASTPTSASTTSGSNGIDIGSRPA